VTSIFILYISKKNSRVQHGEHENKLAASIANTNVRVNDIILKYIARVNDMLKYVYICRLKHVTTKMSNSGVS